MDGIKLKLGLLASLLLLSGCISRETTRLPSLAAGDPRAERRAYEFHDPLPEREIGGQLSDSLPRGFDLQRTESRRTLERSVNPVPYGADGASTGYPGTAFRYRNVVDP